MNGYKKKMNKKRTELAIKYHDKYIEYECDNGKYYGVQLPHCLACKYNTFVFYDYTGGPYSFLCKLNMETKLQKDGCYCLKFEPDENTEVSWKVIK